LLTPAGLAKIEAAKQNGSWTSLDAIEALVIPADLQQALAANPLAESYFERFSDSSKKTILYWISSAKRLETRLSRIEKTVQAAAQNQNPLTR